MPGASGITNSGSGPSTERVAGARDQHEDSQASSSQKQQEGQKHSHAGAFSCASKIAFLTKKFGTTSGPFGRFLFSPMASELVAARAGVSDSH